MALKKLRPEANYIVVVTTSDDRILDRQALAPQAAARVAAHVVRNAGRSARPLHAYVLTPRIAAIYADAPWQAPAVMRCYPGGRLGAKPRAVKRAQAMTRAPARCFRGDDDDARAFRLALRAPKKRARKRS
ncbi:MAG: hypothetical protein IPJ61_19710 [Tessaracoccus sp.]|uniref:hypothetical protein n=1 Tax=Tessaracoccus sp. TaxID=1971211 RepID=UPI001EBE5612|nr:hypothetical protein [Tessaracoccus sp.]MBK7823214.1 hypothetical protein [Tessaracoccus sp.]